MVPCRVTYGAFHVFHGERSSPYGLAIGALPPPQSCATRLPPTTTPGLYFSAVPDSLISTAIPFVSLSSNRNSEAS